MKDKQACGCTHNGHAWLTLCAAHGAETAALHARAAAEHRAAASPTAARSLTASPTAGNDWLDP